MTKERVGAGFLAALAVHESLSRDFALHAEVAALAAKCLVALKAGGKIIFAGNGGSFADSQHLAAELISRLQYDRAPLPSIALGTNSSSMSAIGNDYGYEYVFSREVAVLGNPGDVFIPITTSGNSPNILGAVAVAKDVGLYVCGLTGETGGKLATVTDCIRVPSRRTERIQEGHILIGHVLCAIIEDDYFGRSL